MRRQDREITQFDEMIQVMEKCDVCRVAFHDEEYPYLIPLNFGMKVKDNCVTLYFHGALKGRKYELMEQDNRVSFEMDCSHTLISKQETGYCTMSYESIIGQGRMEIVTEEEKMDALTILTDHYHMEHFKFDPAALPATIAFKLVVEKMTGKRRCKE